MINLQNYQKLKLKNAVNLVKAGDAYAVAYKKFDETTGENLPDAIEGVVMTELTDRKKVLQDEIVEIDAFITDCEAIGIIK